MSMYVRSSYDIPSAMQLTPYEDRSNPLISYKGNPDLKRIPGGFMEICIIAKYNQLKKYKSILQC